MYQEVYVTYKPVKTVYRLVDGRARIEEHDPWCIVSEDVVRSRNRGKLKELGIDIEEDYKYEEDEIGIINFDETRLVFDENDIIPSIRVTATNPQQIGKLAEALDAIRVLHSLSNIRYNARVSLDFADTIFKIRTPAIIHYTHDEIGEVLVDVLDWLPKIKLAVMDIEVEASGAFPKRGDKVLLAGLLYGDLGGDYEIELLEGDDVFETVKNVLRANPYYLVTYNGIGFDLPYLRAYMEGYGVSGVEDKGFRLSNSVVPCLDLYLFTKNFASSLGVRSTVARSLVSVSRELGVISEREEMIERSIDYTRLKEIYEKERDKLFEYLETDLKLTYRIACKWLPVLVILYILSGISPWSLQELPSMGSLAEYALAEYIMRKHLQAYPVRRRKLDYGEEGNLPIYGKGHKTIARRGIYTNVLQLDFDMLYPTIYYMYKVDPAGIDTSFKITHGDAFVVPLRKVIDKEKKEYKRFYVLVRFKGGKVHEFFTHMVNLRRLTKKLKKSPEKRIADLFTIADQASKIFVNASYGIFAKKRGYGINELVSAFIFFKGDQILNRTVFFVENVLGRRVVYGDTDSVFIEMKEDDDPEELTERINRYVKLYGEDLHLKVENIHKYVIVYEKKNYMTVTKDEEVVIKGIHRFYAPKVIKDNLHNIIREVIENRRKPEDVVMEYLRKEPILMNLFAESVRDAEDYYDKKQKKFKRVGHPTSKACLIAYARDIGLLASDDGKVTVGIDTSALGEGIMMSAYWVRVDPSTVAVFDGEENGKVRMIIARMVSQKVDNRSLVVAFQYSRRWVDREWIIRMAFNTTETVLKILRKVYSLGCSEKETTLADFF